MIDHRQPPQDLEAERDLISILMWDEKFEQLPEVMTIVTPDSFARADHQIVFNAICEMMKSNVAVTPGTLRDVLARADVLEKIGGYDTLIELGRASPAACHAKHFAEIVQRKFLLREQILIAHQTIQAAHEHDANPVLLQANVIKAMSDVGSELTIQADRPADEIFADMLESLDRRTIAKGMDFQLVGIDNFASMLPGDLIVISARPAEGKSVLSLQIAHDVACTGEQVGYLSFEMLPEHLAMRMAQRFTGITSRQLRRGQYSQEEDLALHKVIIPHSLHIAHFAPGTSIDVVTAKSIAMSGRHRVSLLVVDYAQQLSAEVRKNDNRANEIAAVIRGLKSVAMRLEIPVIAVAQLNRESEKASRRPRLADLAESAELEKAASVIIAIHYPNKADEDDSPESDVELVVLKNRNGECVVAKYVFDRRFLEFRKAAMDRMLPPEPDNQTQIAWGGE